MNIGKRKNRLSASVLEPASSPSSQSSQALPVFRTTSADALPVREKEAGAMVLIESTEAKSGSLGADVQTLNHTGGHTSASNSFIG